MSSTAESAAYREVLGAKPTLHHATLSVRDLAATTDWYVRVLGFSRRSNVIFKSVVDGSERPFMTLLEYGDVKVALCNVPEVENSDQGFLPFLDVNRRRGHVSFAIRVPDAHQAMEDLQDQGVAVQKHLTTAASEEAADTVKSAWFWDCEGNLIQLWSGRLSRGTRSFPS